jgi:hypothetical protein
MPMKPELQLTISNTAINGQRKRRSFGAVRDRLWSVIRLSIEWLSQAAIGESQIDGT